MPSDGTPRRAVRVPDALWHAAQSTAQARGDNLSDIIRQALTQYINQHQGEK